MTQAQRWPRRGGEPGENGTDGTNRTNRTNRTKGWARACAGVLAVAGLGLAVEAGVMAATRPPPGLQDAVQAVPADDAVDPAAERGVQGLAQAGRMKKAAYVQEGDARRQALLEAADAYGALADEEGLPPEVRAEAAFRAGEILRAQEQPEAALQRFEQAAGFGDSEPAQGFAARGLLEQGHALRRAGDVEGALKIYERLALAFPDQRRSCAHAATWAGKLMIRNGREEDGVQRLVGFAAAFPEYPSEAIRNADLAAVHCARDGDTERAMGIVQDVRTAMEARMLTDDREADRIRKALDAMKAPTLLAGA